MTLLTRTLVGDEKTVQQFSGNLAVVGVVVVDAAPLSHVYMKLSKYCSLLLAISNKQISVPSSTNQLPGFCQIVVGQAPLPAVMGQQ